jgi:hypothetical protein
MARGTLGAHPSSIGGEGGVGAASGDGRRLGSDGAAAVARMPAQCGDELSHRWPWELEWGLGNGSESLAGHGRERRREFTGGANGGRRRTEATACVREERRGRGFIGRATLRGCFTRALLATVATAWARRRLATCSGLVANGGRWCARRRVWRGRVAPA